MATYRVINSPFLLGSRRFAIGEQVEFEGVPGLCLLPLGDEARAAKLAAVLADERKSQHVAPGGSVGTVNTPRLGGNHGHRIKLAKSLGAGSLEDYTAYSEFISNWIATQQSAQEN